MSFSDVCDSAQAVHGQKNVSSIFGTCLQGDGARASSELGDNPANQALDADGETFYLSKKQTNPWWEARDVLCQGKVRSTICSLLLNPFASECDFQWSKKKEYPAKSDQL